jgi:hypothetical protein
LSPDPHFYTDPDQNPVQTNDCGSMRIWIQIHNIIAKNIPMKVHKQFKTSYICLFCSVSMHLLWIWIRIPNTDPDPGQPNKCGSMQSVSKSATLQQSTVNFTSVFRN